MLLAEAEARTDDALSWLQHEKQVHKENEAAWQAAWNEQTAWNEQITTNEQISLLNEPTSWIAQGNAFEDTSTNGFTFAAAVDAFPSSLSLSYCCCFFFFLSTLSISPP